MRNFELFFWTYPFIIFYFFLVGFFIFIFYPFANYLEYIDFLLFFFLSSPFASSSSSYFLFSIIFPSLFNNFLDVDLTSLHDWFAQPSLHLQRFSVSDIKSPFWWLLISHYYFFGNNQPYRLLIWSIAFHILKTFLWASPPFSNVDLSPHTHSDAFLVPSASTEADSTSLWPISSNQASIVIVCLHHWQIFNFITISSRLPPWNSNRNSNLNTDTIWLDS